MELPNYKLFYLAIFYIVSIIPIATLLFSGKKEDLNNVHKHESYNKAGYSLRPDDGRACSRTSNPCRSEPVHGPMPH
jgi:hypothetical protein